MIVILVVTIARRGDKQDILYQVPVPQNNLFVFWEDFLPFKQPSFFQQKNMEKSEGKPFLSTWII